ncbi:RNA-binding protein 25-like [Lates japonicus]
MSYPPPLNRQQIGIPQLPPRIPPPQYGGFAPAVPPGTPMIPVHMGVVTPTPTVLVPTTVAVAQKPVAPKKGVWRHQSQGYRRQQWPHHHCICREYL